MIVEERCYTLKPEPFNSITRTTTRAGGNPDRILGNLIGYFHTEIGELNQIVHLWGYDLLAERERRRALLARDPEWQEYLKQSPENHRQNGEPDTHTVAVLADKMTFASWRSPVSVIPGTERSEGARNP